MKKYVCIVLFLILGIRQAYAQNESVNKLNFWKNSDKPQNKATLFDRSAPITTNLVLEAMEGSFINENADAVPKLNFHPGYRNRNRNYDYGYGYDNNRDVWQNRRFGRIFDNNCSGQIYFPDRGYGNNQIFFPRNRGIFNNGIDAGSVVIGAIFGVLLDRLILNGRKNLTAEDWAQKSTVNGSIMTFTEFDETYMR